MNKKIQVLILVILMTVLFTGSAYAGNWKQGKGENGDRWWYEDGMGNYPANQWMWIDGNGDGTAECYYFDSDGWMMSGKLTPDGYQVDSEGRWVLDGEIQQKSVLDSYQKQVFTDAAKAFLHVYEKEFYQPDYTMVQNRYDIMYEDRCVLLQQCLNIETEKLLENPQTKAIYPAVRQEEQSVCFQAEESEKLFSDIFGIGLNPAPLKQTEDGLLIGIPVSSDLSYQAAITDEISDSSYTYLKISYVVNQAQTGERIREGDLYMTLRENDRSAAGVTIDLFSNQESHG